MSLGNIRLSAKLGAIMALSLAGLVLATYLGLDGLKSNLLYERERQTKNLVDATFNIFDNLQKKVDAGELSIDTAQKQATDTINSIRYGEDNYLWVNDKDAVMIVHPIKPNLNGKDLSTFKSADGQFLFSEIVKLAKAKGEGIIHYSWPKPGFDEPVDKISYVKMFEPWGWVIGTGVYIDNVQTTFMQEATKQAIIFAIGTLLLGAAVYLVSHDIRGSVKALSKTMNHLASGNTDTEVPLQGRTDEMGDMAHSVAYFRERLIENDRLAQRQKIEEETQQKRAQLIQKLANEFDTGINVALESVASAAKQLDMTASGMSATANQTTVQATAVASASQQTSSNVQTVAAAAEELTASITEVGNQVSMSTQIAHKAAEKARTTQQTVRSLSQTADQISEASKLIAEIADQTNMLALNATIEAARAGEMGKGFAVVASEVKTLATQTSRATQEIESHIRAIQSVSQATVVAIDDIDSVIQEMNEIADAVSAAVEEQNAATQEITRNIEQAAQGTEEVTGNIAEVKHAANDTGKASKEVLDASSQLNDQSTSLRSVVESFLNNVKSA